LPKHTPAEYKAAMLKDPVLGGRYKRACDKQLENNLHHQKFRTNWNTMVSSEGYLHLRSHTDRWVVAVPALWVRSTLHNIDQGFAKHDMELMKYYLLDNRLYWPGSNRSIQHHQYSDCLQCTSLLPPPPL